MSILITRRRWIWFGILFVLLNLGSDPSPVLADSHCRVTMGRGWGSGTGQALIVMKNTGQPCVVELFSDPDNRIGVDMIQVVKHPQNGVVAVTAPKFSYAPNAGFTGRDRFELSAAGSVRGGRRASLSGEVVVQVNP